LPEWLEADVGAGFEVDGWRVAGEAADEHHALRVERDSAAPIRTEECNPLGQRKPAVVDALYQVWVSAMRKEDAISRVTLRAQLFDSLLHLSNRKVQVHFGFSAHALTSYSSSADLRSYSPGAIARGCPRFRARA
jgi:hypothetical protein